MTLAGLNVLEQAVMEKLLAGDHVLLAALRRQADSTLVVSREYTGVGFYCVFEVRAPGVEGPLDFELADVYAAMEGVEHGVGFVLFVRNGRLAWLEGATFEGPWPRTLDRFQLFYRNEPRELPFP